MHIKITYVALAAIVWLGSTAHAEEPVSLAVWEREPYVGKNLEDQGYAIKVLKAAFEEVGLETQLTFQPLPRARESALQGIVDGYFPLVIHSEDDADFLLSDPFPGGSIGLLKKKNSSAQWPSPAPRTLPEVQSALKGYRLGLVSGEDINSLFENAPAIQKDYVRTDLNNLDKLYRERIDFTFMDKYTAADLIVLQRPHMIGSLEFIDPPLLNTRFQVGFPRNKENHFLLWQKFNTGLNILQESGKLDLIMAEHGFGQKPTPPPSKTILTIGTVNNADMKVIKELSSRFTKQYPDIQLDWRVMNENTLRRRLLSDFAISDGKFDVMTIGTYEAPLWAEKGWLVPLDNLPESYDVNDIFETVRESLSYQSKLYALPIYAESTMTYYRKDLFAQADLKMPRQPTWYELRDFAARLHDPAKNIYGICLRGKAGWGENMAIITTMVNTFGGRWFDNDWIPQLTSKPWIKAILMYKELLNRYGPPDVTRNGFNETLKLFAEGHCAMWVDATVAAGLLFDPKQSSVHDKVGFSAAPIGTVVRGANWLWSWALAIPESSRNTEAALKFITWATSKEYIRMVGTSNGWVSVPPATRQSTYEHPEYRQAAPFSEFVLNAIQTADPVNSTLEPKPYKGIQLVGIPEFPSIGRAVGLSISEVIDKKKTAQEALKESQQLVQQQMRDSGYYQ
ncbi:hypothetical protein BTA51_27215 [Hahella sp. CCB-MM4]|uniref:extracellular solute-binding protein n=1 Tax=Hahella sp. (strain CCB-MM4) TaxID=1926491 RepID=UPI000B9A47C5|nr:extracellular solute-binding protein [Hahella sp. CCB-MM4]OZG70168.1 hypothetical protein BTA51_27215 [Hahella sp. CCB-MM4]